MADREAPQGGMAHPQFFYPDTPSVFFARTGWGPLIVSLDTNLLILLAQNLEEIGGSFGVDGQGFRPELWDDSVRALDDLFLLWFWRDVRLFLVPEQMRDGRLTSHRARSRQSVLDAFAEDFWQRGGFSRESHMDGEQIEDGVDLKVPCEWPASFDEALPRGMDGILVRSALTSGAHVFLSTDRHVLRRAHDLARFSLAVADPAGLMEALDSSGELARTAGGDVPLVPDLQSLGHFYGVVPQENE